eukprot:Pgem_evm1s7755
MVESTNFSTEDNNETTFNMNESIKIIDSEDVGNDARVDNNINNNNNSNNSNNNNFSIINNKRDNFCNSHHSPCKHSVSVGTDSKLIFNSL